MNKKVGPDNPVLFAVVNRIQDQQAKGLAKYGKPIDPDSCNLLEWIEHSLQEKTDDLIYMECIRQKLLAIQDRDPMAFVVCKQDLEDALDRIRRRYDGQ